MVGLDLERECLGGFVVCGFEIEKSRFGFGDL